MLRPSAWLLQLLDNRAADYPGHDRLALDIRELGLLSDIISPVWFLEEWGRHLILPGGTMRTSPAPTSSSCSLEHPSFFFFVLKANDSDVQIDCASSLLHFFFVSILCLKQECPDVSSLKFHHEKVGSRMLSFLEWTHHLLEEA
jgi:hypothetical protein